MWAPDYLTAAQLKSALRITDTDDDAEIAFAITAASRAIDAECGRQFGVLSSPAPRYYTARWDRDRCRYVVSIDDLMTTTGLVVKTDLDGDGTFETTLTLNTDFRLVPFNAAADNRPWTMLVPTPFVTPTGITGAGFPAIERGVQVTASFGWTAVPGVVEQATLIQAARFFKRKDAPFGIAGSPEIGSELRLLAKLDPDVALLLGTVRRYWGAV